MSVCSAIAMRLAGTKKLSKASASTWRGRRRARWPERLSASTSTTAPRRSSGVGGAPARPEPPTGARCEFVHGGGEMEIERITVFVGLRRLLPVVPGAGAQRRVDRIDARSLLIWPEEVGQRLLAQAAHATEGVSSMRPPCCSMSPASASDLVRGWPGRSRRPGRRSRPCAGAPGPGRSHRAAAGVEADCRTSSMRSSWPSWRWPGRWPSRAHRALAVEVVGLLPAGVGHGALEVLEPGAPPASAGPCRRGPSP